MGKIKLINLGKRHPDYNKLKNHVFKGLFKENAPKDKIKLLEVRTSTTPNGTHKFICGYPGSIWEVWLVYGKFTPPVLTGDELPIAAQIYFEWRLGSGWENHVNKLVWSGQKNLTHGEIAWCYVYHGENQEVVKYYQDGFFYPNGFSWFPEGAEKSTRKKKNS